MNIFHSFKFRIRKTLTLSTDILEVNSFAQPEFSKNAILCWVMRLKLIWFEKTLSKFTKKVKECMFLYFCLQKQNYWHILENFVQTCVHDVMSFRYSVSQQMRIETQIPRPYIKNLSTDILKVNSFAQPELS